MHRAPICKGSRACTPGAKPHQVLLRRFAVKRTKKVFRDDGGLSPAFCERLRHQIDIYHAVGHGLSIAHLYGAYEDAEYVYSVQELCTGMHCCSLLQISCSAAQLLSLCVQKLDRSPMLLPTELVVECHGDHFCARCRW